MARTCLVTGGAGFIGCAISSLVKNQFDRVVALDNMHPQVHPTSQRPAGLDPAVELVVGDVTEAATWDTLLAGFMPDVIIVQLVISSRCLDSIATRVAHQLRLDTS